MRTRTTLATLTWILLMTAPSASAHDDGPHAGEGLLYYLNSDGYNLNLTTLPPSAANASSWDLELDDGWYWDEAYTLVLAPPSPFFVLNESAGFSGSLTLHYARQSSLMGQCANLRMDVDLVEGARRVTALSTTVATYERVYEFGGDFPGHGRDAAPHTHGDGSSLERGLRTDDIAFEVRFTLVDSLASEYSLGSCVHRVSVGIDGTSFAQLSALAPAAAPPPAPNVPANQSQGTNGTSPEQGNQSTTGNASSNAGTNADQSPDGRLYLATEEESVNTPAAGLLPAAGAVAAGAAVARRRRLT